MSTVAISIGGRSFTVTCADGEETRIAKLGELIDGKVRALGNGAGQNEVRMLLYAALVIADELDETQARLASANPAPVADPQLDGRLGAIAGKLENLALALEQRQSSP